MYVITVTEVTAGARPTLVRVIAISVSILHAILRTVTLYTAQIATGLLVHARVTLNTKSL